MRRTGYVAFLLVAFVAWGGASCDSEDGGPTTWDIVSDTPGGDADSPPDVVVAPDSTPDIAPPPPCECDDQILCTNDECDEDGECFFENISMFTGDVIGQAAPDFTLTDRNPESATAGEEFTLAELHADGVLVVAFHAADCASCLEQGKAARSWYAGLSADEAQFIAINTAAAADDIEAYVNADPATVEGDGPPSTWPVLQDTDAADVWERYCADTDMVVVIDQQGLVRYVRTVNFDDDNFVTELDQEIEFAQTPVQP